MAKAADAYAAYSYLVSWQGAGNQEKVLGGFSSVSGLTSHVRKISGVHKAGDITLKRGVVVCSDLLNWISQVRTSRVPIRRHVLITLRDGAGNPLQRWKLAAAWVSKYTGPTLTGEGRDVAVEELELCVEKMELVPPR